MYIKYFSQRAGYVDHTWTTTIDALVSLLLALNKYLAKKKKKTTQGERGLFWVSSEECSPSQPGKHDGRHGWVHNVGTPKIIRHVSLVCIPCIEFWLGNNNLSFKILYTGLIHCYPLLALPLPLFPLLLPNAPSAFLGVHVCVNKIQIPWMRECIWHLSF